MALAMDDNEVSRDRRSFNHSRARDDDLKLRLAYSVEQFSERTDLSRSLLYEAIKLGELQSIKIRGRRLILAEDGLAWLRAHRERTP
jgi:excisionase family DNA binding protein